jgi:hypothetical protein
VSCRNRVRPGRVASIERDHGELTPKSGLAHRSNTDTTTNRLGFFIALGTLCCVTDEVGYERRHRSAGVLAAILSYATALFLSYVATFVLFVTTPFRPYGPYRGRTCQAPHLLFGQICRDWVEHGMTPGSRVGWGAVFLSGFLLLALLARRFTSVFLLVPLALLPYVNTERRVWIVVAVVSVIATLVISGLRVLAGGHAPPLVRFLPVELLAVFTACAATFSGLYSGPPLPTLTSTPGLVSYKGTWLQGITCSSASACVAVGTGEQEPVAIAMHGTAWGAARIVQGAESLRHVACSSTGDCIADDFNARIAIEHNGVWRTDLRGPAQLNLPVTACSQNGICWVIYQRSVSTGQDSSYQVPEAVGEINGQLLSAHQVGPATTASESPNEDIEYVSGMSCWSATSCTLVGSQAVTHGWRTFVQSETRGVWKPVSWVPSDLGGNPKNFFGVFPIVSPISCTADGDCLLGGYEGRGTGPNIGSAIQQDDDGHWLPTTIGTGSQLGGQYSQVSQLECRTAALCVAAGGGNSHGHGWLFFRTDLDGRWGTSRIVPIEHGYFSVVGGTDPTAAACPTSTSCYVVGFWSRSGYFNRVAFVATYTHQKWAFKLYALGRGESSTELLGLACTSAACWAVGTATYPQSSTSFVYPLVHLDPASAV